MGMVFGKTNVAEPAFEIIFQRSAPPMSYTVRKYGERFAAETSWEASSGKNEDESPFTLLAKYIGVFGTPQNEGSIPISMTAPVMKQQKETEPIAIAMTAPVVKTTNNSNEKTMMFVLPDQYTSLESIPKPTNPNVHIIEIPPAVGVVYTYSGSMDDKVAEENAIKLGKQIRSEYKLDDIMTDEYVLQNYQFWGYSPPFTLPMFRRNEVWLPLDDEQLKRIIDEPLATDFN